MDCPLVFVNLSEAAANLKCRPIEVIKLNSGNAMFGAISEKFRTLDMQIILAIPPIFHVGILFFLHQRHKTSVTLSINWLRKLKTF